MTSPSDAILTGSIVDQQIAENERLRGENAELTSRVQRLEAELREERKARLSTTYAPSGRPNNSTGFIPFPMPRD